jgi:hypothetical protein
MSTRSRVIILGGDYKKTDSLASSAVRKRGQNVRPARRMILSLARSMIWRLAINTSKPLSLNRGRNISVSTNDSRRQIAR